MKIEKKKSKNKRCLIMKQLHTCINGNTKKNIEINQPDQTREHLKHNKTIIKKRVSDTQTEEKNLTKKNTLQI